LYSRRSNLAIGENPHEIGVFPDSTVFGRSAESPRGHHRLCSPRARRRGPEVSKTPAFRDSLLQLVVFIADGQRYALPLVTVQRVLPMVAVSALPGSPAIALGVINLHGRVVPILDIRRRFGLPPRDWGLTGHLLVARTSRRVLAVPVDEVLGVSEVVEEAVARPDAILPGVGHVAGIVALPDGVLFIHDLEGFLSLDEEQRLAEALEADGAVKQARDENSA
jgi:purine-binding chemotaxis protein CheW